MTRQISSKGFGRVPCWTARLRQGATPRRLRHLLAKIEAADAGQEVGRSRRLTHQLVRLAFADSDAWPQQNEPATRSEGWRPPLIRRPRGRA
jgi:hypothetical protein